MTCPLTPAAPRGCGCELFTGAYGCWLVRDASVVIAAIFHVGRDSVLIAMLLHATNNAVGGNFASQLFVDDDQNRLPWLTAAGWVAVAGVILAVKAKTSPRQHRGQATAGVVLESMVGQGDRSLVG